MKTKLSLIGVLASLLLGACSKSIVLNDYVIVKPAAATATEAKAASELQKYLFEISGAELPVVSDSAPPTDRATYQADMEVHSRIRMVEAWVITAVYNTDL